MNDTKVGARLAARFAAVRVLMVAVGAISLSRMAAIKANLAAATGEAPGRLASRLRELSRIQAVALRDAVLRDDRAFKKKEFDLMQQASAECAKALNQLMAMPLEPEVARTLGAAGSTLALIKAPVEKAIDLSMSDDLQGSAQVIRDEVRSAQLALVAAFEQVVLTIRLASRARNDMADQAYEESVALIIGLLVVALARGGP